MIKERRGRETPPVPFCSVASLTLDFSSLRSEHHKHRLWDDQRESDLEPISFTGGFLNTPIDIIQPWAERRSKSGR